MSRSYYSNELVKFLNDDNNLILPIIMQNHHFTLEEQQRNAWLQEIKILKKELKNFNSGHILFEYSIPRMGKRADIILLLNGLIFVIEFKINEKQYKNSDLEQCLDYALDLKYFHKESYDAKIIPILIAIDAINLSNSIKPYHDGIFQPLKCNKNNLNNTLLDLSQFGGNYLDPIKWENSIYKPTPTIIEAAQALYQGHDVREIAQSDSGADNLIKTANIIEKIINKAKKEKTKAICFITGVPGAGKTLGGLNLANERHKFSKEEEHTVFLSGNGPLVEVLQEALARNKVKNSIEPIKKKNVLRETKAFIQNIHHFRDEALLNNYPPNEKVIIFDEAQRAWNQKKTSSFMKTKRNRDNFSQSEPEFLISVMDRHNDWCVIICLIGGGQEINTGEAGLLEWFSAIKKQFNYWEVYVSDKISDIEYSRGYDLNLFFDKKIKYEIISDLHLKISIRSFRSENVSNFVKALLDCDKNNASKLFVELEHKYPIFITRDLQKAKKWLKQKSRGNERFGLIASSSGMRLKPYGIFVELKIDPKNWFLNSKDDVRSSYFLEYVATEFDIQGLELDWVCVAWDADFRYINNMWNYYNFKGNNWQKIKDKESILYLKNAYRVLLTRARQGMIIFIPYGDENDPTRITSFYDGTYEYLKEIGLKEII